MRGNNAACCLIGALVLAILLGLALWPMLRDWVAGEVEYQEQIEDFAD